VKALFVQPVFVDPSGRRIRRVRRVGVAVGVPATAYLALLVSSVLSGPTVETPLLWPSASDRKAAPQKSSGSPADNLGMRVEPGRPRTDGATGAAERLVLSLGRKPTGSPITGARLLPGVTTEALRGVTIARRFGVTTELLPGVTSGLPQGVHPLVRTATQAAGPAQVAAKPAILKPAQPALPVPVVLVPAAPVPVVPVPALPVSAVPVPAVPVPVVLVPAAPVPVVPEPALPVPAQPVLPEAVLPEPVADTAAGVVGGLVASPGAGQ
jgi:hypothetical protein